jgi:hypothetical protein
MSSIGSQTNRERERGDGRRVEEREVYIYVALDMYT